MTDALEDALGVVDRPVIGALLDHRDAERPLALPGVRVLDQRIGADALADRGLVELVRPDRADQAIGVAVGRQVDRDAARHQQRALMGGLVVVAVEQDEVALGDQARQHDLVGRRRAVQHEIGLLRAEDRGGLLLGLQRRAFVGQEVAEFEDRIVEVVAEHRLAQMLHEDPADRAAAVEDAAVVARAGPELVALFGVVDQRAEERRLQRLGILLEARHEVLGDELGRLLGQEHIAVDVVEHLDRDVLEALAPDEDDDRHVEAAPPHQVDQRGGLALDALLAPVDHQQPIAASVWTAISASSTRRALITWKPIRSIAAMIWLTLQALEIVGVEHRRGEKEGESLEEVHSFWAPRRVGAQSAPREPAQLRQDAGDRIKTFVRAAVSRPPPDGVSPSGMRPLVARAKPRFRFRATA